MYHNYIWWQNELIFYQIYLIYAEQSLAELYSTGIYFYNYFRCCCRRPWWDDVFPCGSTLFINFPNKNVRNITEIMDVILVYIPAEINVSLRELFRERVSLYRHICELFQKGEWMDSLDPRGNKSLNGNNRSHKRLILAKNHLSKSNNLDMFALEANTLFLLFSRVKPRQLEPWYIEASAYVE